LAAGVPLNVAKKYLLMDIFAFLMDKQYEKAKIKGNA